MLSSSHARVRLVGFVLASTLGACVGPNATPQTCVDVASCRGDCDAGSAEGCFLLGYRFEGGIEAAQDLTRAERLYKRSCGAGFQAGCLGWMRLLSTSEDNGRLAIARQLGQAACVEGYGEGCLRAGLLGEAKGGALIAQGVAMLRRTCAELSDDSSCTILANLAFSGALGAADLRVAARAYDRTCAGGDPHTCVRLAELSEDGHPDVLQVARLSPGEYFEAACALGLLRACTESLTRRWATSGGALDAEIQEALRPLCDVGEADACGVLARLHFMEGEAEGEGDVRARTLYERGCNLGSGSACNSYGMMTAAGLGGARAVSLAYDGFRRGCDMGEHEACMNAAWMEAQDLVHGQDPGLAQRQLKAACARGDGESCHRASQLVSRDGDSDEAQTLMERGCRLGEGEACAALAAWVLESQGNLGGGPRALELAAYACQSYSGAGCMLAGSLYERGIGASVDLAMAQSFFHRACAHRTAAGCEALARRVGGELATDLWAVGKRLRKQACREGSASDCVTFGVYLHRGLGGEAAVEAAATVYAVACEAGEAEGCLHAGQLWATGSGVEVSYDRAHAFFHRGCELENNDACAWEGLGYHLGRGATQDIARAAAIYERTCADGSAFGCVGMGKLYERGDGRPASSVKAQVFFNQACAAGEQRYCR